MATNQQILIQTAWRQKQKHVRSLLILRSSHYPKRWCRSQEEKKNQIHCIPVAFAQAQVRRGMFQLYFQRQRLAGLEAKGPGNLHRLSYRATPGSADSIPGQVVLQWIWPQVLFDNLSNSVGFWKAVV